ncbi:MAG TPA: hypothetical protein VIZ69_00665 [Thermoanaerobaculia bacterium]
MTGPEDDPRNTKFGSILAYVLGFMVVLAALAFVAAWLLRR